MPSRAESKRFRSLHARKGRATLGLCLAEGPRLLGEIARSGLAPVHVLYTPAALADPVRSSLIEPFREKGVPCEELSEKQLAVLADAVTPQGVLAIVPIPSHPWPENARHFLVLDRIQDPGNVGTLLRTAEALGVQGVHVLPGTADPWSPKALRAAAGSTFRIPLASADWSATHEHLTGHDIEIWVADSGGEPAAADDARPQKLALVLGNEGDGIDPRIRKLSGRSVCVPLAPPVESLNVAVAGAILMDRLFGGAVGR